MSLPGLNNPGAPQGLPSEKPKSDVYTMLLMIALLAIGAGIAMLCNEMNKYEWDPKAQSIQKPAPMPR
jgi:hypothetical protein